MGDSFLDRASKCAPRILRLGLATVILWFGFSQIFDAASWTSWVPHWASFFGLTALQVVYLNGAFEAITGILLVLGILARPIAVLLFLHLAVLVVDIGITPIGVRDFGLAVAFLYLALSKPASNAESIVVEN